MNYCIVVSYGDKLRNFHREVLSYGDKLIVDEIVHRVVAKVEAMGKTIDAPQPQPKSLPPKVEPTLTQGEIARTKGFTGNACEECHGFNMTRTGTCETCGDCGWNKGCG